jgi:hypothetical protein
MPIVNLPAFHLTTPPGADPVPRRMRAAASRGWNGGTVNDSGVS